jgi:uncharacterized protein with NRDE domain
MMRMSNKTHKYIKINKRESYNPYNILIGNPKELYVYNNVSNETHKLTDGFHGLSNAYLNSPWPKVSRGIEHLKKLYTKFRIKKRRIIFYHER